MTVLLAALALAATPLPALAIVESTKETFSGTAVGDDVILRSDEGPSCHGSLSAGQLSCSDGRAGTFSYRRGISGGLAYGSLDDEDFTLVVD